MIQAQNGASTEDEQPAFQGHAGEQLQQDQLAGVHRIILAGLAAGQTYNEIARAQGWNARTTRIHARELFRQLGIRSRLQAAELVHSIRTLRETDLQVLGTRYRLTRREQQVLPLLVRRPDLKRQGIGRLLGISDATTRNVLHNIYRKMGVHSRPQVIVQIAHAFTERQTEGHP